MKILKVILITFIIAFITSALYEIPFINTNPVRYVLVIVLIIIELMAGFGYTIYEIKKIIKTKSEIPKK